MSNTEDVQDFKDTISEAVHELGPLVIEHIECHHCGRTELSIHPFAESIECGGCGLRNASSVPIYLDVDELFEEGEDMKE